MVSFSTTIAFVVTAFGVAQGYPEIEAQLALDFAALLPEGAYYRPPSSSVSGAVNSTAPFRRSPCPATNTLANHGYIPRDGKNITVDTALAVVMDKFNIAEDLAAVMGGLSPDLFDLNDLSKHNDKVEHDGYSTATTFVATFFLQEMFPEGWTKPDMEITYDDALATISYLDAVNV